MRERLLLRISAILVMIVNHVKCNFNFYVDKEEFHRITGGTLSQVYLVRDGVANDYALGYVMTIPYTIQYLDFKWQATTKKPVHYEVVIEFSDFFALLQPSANISTVGRLPHKLETFRVALPCSGRLTTEVPVILRFTFHVKHTTKNNGQGHNVTTVNVKRNKICLLKENHHHHPTSDERSIDEKRVQIYSPTLNNTTSIHQTTPTPSLLLAGLLGGCAVTATLVSVLFLVCLKKRLNKLDNGTIRNGGRSGGSGSKYYEYDEVENSPACLLRQNRKPLNKNNGQYPPDVINFWGESSLNGNMSSGGVVVEDIATLDSLRLHKNQNLEAKGSDVSPYAYAQIIHPNKPCLTDWHHLNYNRHIYANQLSSFRNYAYIPTNENGLTIMTRTKKGEFESYVGKGYTNYTRSFGSDSLAGQVGSQFPKRSLKETQIEERFL